MAESRCSEMDIASNEVMPILLSCADMSKGWF